MHLSYFQVTTVTLLLSLDLLPMDDDFTDSELDALLLEIRQYNEWLRQTTEQLQKRQLQWEATCFNRLTDQISSSLITLQEPNEFESITAEETIVDEEETKAIPQDDADDPERDGPNTVDGAAADDLLTDGVELDNSLVGEAQLPVVLDLEYGDSYYALTLMLEDNLPLPSNSICGLMVQDKLIASMWLASIIVTVDISRSFSFPVSIEVSDKMHTICLRYCSTDFSALFTEIIDVFFCLLRLSLVCITVSDPGAAGNVWCLNFSIILECSLPLVIAAINAIMMTSFSDFIMPFGFGDFGPSIIEGL